MASKDADEDALGLLKRDDYRVVAYEALAADAAGELDAISRWRGHGRLGAIERKKARWHVDATSDAECKPGKTCRRDGAAVAARWRSELSRADVAAIEADDRCARTMGRHNYTKLEDIIRSAVKLWDYFSGCFPSGALQARGHFHTMFKFTRYNARRGSARRRRPA